MKNLKKAVVPLLILIILFVIFLQLDIGVSNQFITSVKKTFNMQISCSDLYAAPLSANGRLKNEKKSEYFNSISIQKNVSEGCLFNAFVTNNTKQMAHISSAALVIENVKSTKISETKLLGSYRDNQVQCHIVNNGNKEMKNINVQLYGYYDNKSGYKMLEDEVLAGILNISPEELIFKVDIISPGEILNVRNFDVDVNALGSLEGRLNIGFKLFEKDMSTELDRGLLGILASEDAVVQFSIGDTKLPDPIKGGEIINVKTGKMQKLKVEEAFSIKSKKQKLVQTIVYPTESCEVEAYMEITTAGKKKKKTKPVTQKIFVPTYKTNYGLYTEVRSWIAANNITNYKYNENPKLQAVIIYEAGVTE